MWMGSKKVQGQEEPATIKALISTIAKKSVIIQPSTKNNKNCSQK